MPTKKPTSLLLPDLKILWLHVCSSASVDQSTNNLSLFNLIEDLQITPPVSSDGKKLELSPGKTATIAANYVLAGLIERTGDAVEEFLPEIRVTITDPDFKIIAENIAPLDFEDGKKRVRSLVNFDGFLVTQPGRYEYALEVRSASTEEFHGRTVTPIEIRIAN